MGGWKVDEGVAAKNRQGRFLLVALLCFLVPNIVVAQNVMEFEVPLMVNKSFIGNINARIYTPTEIIQERVLAEDAVAGPNALVKQQAEPAKKTTQVEIPISRFKELVVDFANQDQLDQWLQGFTDQDQTEEMQYVSLASLQSRGLKVDFDPSMLTIDTLIPRLGTQQFSVRGRDKPTLDDHYTQSPFASGLSFYVRSRYNHAENARLTKGLDDSHWSCRRLNFLRGLVNEQKTRIFPRSTGTRSSVSVNHRT